MEMQLLEPTTVARLRRVERSVLRLARRLRGGEMEVLDLSLTSTAGYTLAARLFLPLKGTALPGVVLCPDQNDGMEALLAGEAPVSPAGLCRLGFAVLVFDPAGRGASWGEEDQGGPEHQDNVAVAWRTLSEVSRVDAARVGIVGLGAGSFMAVGAAASLGTAPHWVLDWEGPADRDTVVSTQGDGVLGTDDETWWRDRAASGLVRRLMCPYARLQAEDDHTCPGELRHALRMMWSCDEAGLAWFQINDHPPGEATGRPVWLASGVLAARHALHRKMLALSRMER